MAAGSIQAKTPFTEPRCVYCDYILTGLTSSRCPECGQTIDWDRVAALMTDTSQIVFERMRGWRKTIGFAITWLTVLFAPWIFARQAVRRISHRHAAVFGAICFVGLLGGLFAGVEAGFLLIWWTTAVVCIAVQALMLTCFDWPHHIDWKNSFKFWLAIGGYTSAVMLTEFLTGPPMLVLGEFLQASPKPAVFSISLTVWEPLDWQWARLFAWIFALACCLSARLRVRRAALWPTLLACSTLVILLLMLYALLFQHVGARLYNLLIGF